MNTRLFRIIVFLFLVLIISTGLAACISAAGKAGAVAPSDPLHLPLVLNQAENPALSPIMLASNQPHPNSLAVDSQNVYWTNCGTDVGVPKDGAVMVYSKSVGVIQPLVSGLSCPDLLQADSDSLFWINRQWIPGFGLYTIFRLSKAGGQPVELASYTHVNGSLVVDDTYVYWRDYSGVVMRLPKTGGIPEPTPVPSLVFDGLDAYWLNADGDLVRSAKDGSSQVTLVSHTDLDGLAGREPSNVYVLQVFPRSTYLYFTVFVDNYPGMLSCTDQHTVLMRIPKSGGALEYLFSAARRLSAWIIEPFAFFSAECTHGPLKVNLENLAVSPSMAWSELPVAMADDQTYVYWVDYDNGWIKRMTK